MKILMLPLMFSIGVIAFENRDKIIDQYTAAYPSDPAKEAAMQECISHNKNFNRLDPDDRQACYRQYIHPLPVAMAPSASPSYPYSPSQLPGNDIRRQEANGSYHPLAVIPPAQAEPLPPAAPPQTRPATHRVPASQPATQPDVTPGSGPRP